jgi:hypothetical protein
MQKPTSSAGLLIVVELGAEWPSVLQAELSSAAPGGARRVLAQEESESPAAFAARVGAQLAGLFARGAALGGAVIACSERLDESARSARADLARAAAGAMAGGGRVLLTASDRNQGRSRSALSTLESELRAEWQSAAVELELRFANDAAAPLTVAQPKAEAQPRRARGSGRDRARRVA